MTDDDDDWDTDPDWENNMSETEKRRAGNIQHLEELNSSTASMSMDAFRARALSLDERAGEIDIANVRAEKAAADKRLPDATTSTTAVERPAAQAKRVPRREVGGRRKRAIQSGKRPWPCSLDYSSNRERQRQRRR